mmetsp:Transcript_36503/g.79802  ORF Transcript_36503/g.79802 Transcript_36503/m.79802 type:complete len:400 (-) Transcript_36503:254-1453(-)
MMCRRKHLAANNAAKKAVLVVLFVSVSLTPPISAFAPGNSIAPILDDISRQSYQVLTTRANGGSSTRRVSRLYDMLPRDDGYGHSSNDDSDSDNEKGEDEEIRSARAKLEALMGGSTSTSPSISSDPSEGAEESKTLYDFSIRPTKTSASAKSSSSPDQRSPSPTSRLHPTNLSHEIVHPPPLTTIGRSRHEAEISSLSSLIDSDDALSDLWTLWFAERGPRASQELMMAEQFAMGGPKYWDKAEERLRKLIDEHGVHWSEPVNRLATLLYQQGRLRESKELCEVVLAVKPWHFGALSGIVMVCAGLGDANAARMWADRRLPPLRPDGDTTERRVEWVERAVREATKSLKRAEHMLQKEFEHCDEEADAERNGRKSNTSSSVAPPKSIVVDDDFGDVWQ